MFCPLVLSLRYHAFFKLSLSVACAQLEHEITTSLTKYYAHGGFLVCFFRINRIVGLIPHGGPIKLSLVPAIVPRLV